MSLWIIKFDVFFTIGDVTPIEIIDQNLVRCVRAKYVNMLTVFRTATLNVVAHTDQMYEPRRNMDVSIIELNIQSRVRVVPA